MAHPGIFLLVACFFVAATTDCKACSFSGLKSESFYDEYARKTILANVLASLTTPEGRVVLGNYAKEIAEKGTMATEKTVAQTIGLVEKALGSSWKKESNEVVFKYLAPVFQEPLKRFPMLGDAVNLITFTRDVTAKEDGWVPSGTVSTSRKLKATAFIGGAIEGAFLVYTGYSSYNKMQQGEISWVQFKQHMVVSTGGAVGSVAGSTVGAAIGSAFTPVVGGLVGSVVGGMIGRYVGKQGGEQFAKLAFDQQCY